MSEVNKIANYNQMMSWLTRPSVPQTETREDFAIGGGVIQGENFGTREGFARPVLLKTTENKGKWKVRFRDEKFGRREGQTGFNEGDKFFDTKEAADAFYEDLLSKKEAKKASGLKSKNVAVKNQAQQINTFVSNFIDQNLANYGIKDYDKFQKELNQAFEKSGIEDAGNRKSKYKGFPNIATAESEVPFSKFDMETINRSAKTDTTGNYFKKLFYTGKLKTDDNFRNRVERYLDYNNTDKKFYGDGNPIDRKALINQYADVLNESAEPNEDIRFLLENKDVGEGKFRSGIIRQFFPEKADIYIKKKATSSASYTKDVATIENFLSDTQIKKTLNGHPSIKSFMKGQSEQLKKIFDASELPDNLNFNTDHVEGIAEIAKLDNPDDVMRGLRNLIGMTQKRNRNLGWKGYSKKRRELTDKIIGGIDTQKNLDELNKITSKSYPEVKNKKAYFLKNGVLSVTDNFKFLSNPETTYKQYFTELTSTKEGLSALKNQYKTNEDLKKLLLEDPNLRKNVIVDDLVETIPGVTTADKLGKPPATVEREMFEKANNNLSPKTVKEDLTNVQKVFRKIQGQLNSGMNPKLLAEYIGAEVKDLSAFGSKYGGKALSKVARGLTGIDLPIVQVMFGSMYDIEQDSPIWLTLPAAFTDEVANVFKLYDKSTGKYGLGKAKDFGKFLASSLVPQNILGRAVRNPLFKAATKVGKAGSFAAPVLELGKQAYLSEKRKGMLPDIARQFDIPIEEAKRGYDNYVKQGQIRGMQSMEDDTEIPEISKQGEDNLNSNINAFKQIGAMLGLNEDPYAEKESIYTRGKENPMSLDRALYPNRQNFRDGTKLLKIAKAGKKGLDYLKDLLKKKTVTVKRGESGTEGASSSFSNPDYKGKYYTPEGGGFETAAEDARYYSKMGGDEGSPKVFTAELTPEEIKEGLRLRALDSQDPEIGDIILPKSAEDKIKIDYLNTIRAKVEKYLNMAEGGRVNFADGPKDPSKKGIGSLNKRQFLKMLALIPAGILAIRGGPNLLNKAKKATTAVTKGFDGAPAHFINLYNKIKNLGKDITEKAATKDGDIITKFKDYELTEDLATGEKTIQRMKVLDDDSASYYGQPLTEETYMSYKPGKGQMDETMKGKTPPDEYEEGTAYLRSDREFAGDVVDESTEISDEVIKEGTMFEDDFLDFQPNKKK